MKDSIVSVRLDGEEIMSVPVEFQTSHEQTAKLLALAINQGESSVYARAKQGVLHLQTARWYHRVWKWLTRFFPRR